MVVFPGAGVSDDKNELAVVHVKIYALESKSAVGIGFFYIFKINHNNEAIRI